MAQSVKVTLIRSLIGSTARQRAMVQTLGLRRISDSTTVPRDGRLEGILRKVGHLLDVSAAANTAGGRANG